MDKQLLVQSDGLGLVARGAGTTSNVLYFHGDTLWTACSGDSRAVLGKWPEGGKAKGIVAEDLGMVPPHMHSNRDPPRVLRTKRCGT